MPPGCGLWAGAGAGLLETLEEVSGFLGVPEGTDGLKLLPPDTLWTDVWAGPVFLMGLKYTQITSLDYV